MPATVSEQPTLLPFTTADVADQLGVSYRQLHYWVDQGVLGPDHQGVGSGRRRQWADRDLRVAQVVVAYVNVAGTNVGVMRDVAEAVQARPDARWLVIAEGVVAAAANDADDLVGLLAELGHTATIVLPIAPH